VLVFAGGFDIILGESYAQMTQQFAPARVREPLAAYVAAIREARRRHQPHIPFDSKDPSAIAAASGRCLNKAI
jgi:hypothetical protein